MKVRSYTSGSRVRRRSDKAAMHLDLAVASEKSGPVRKGGWQISRGAGTAAKSTKTGSYAMHERKLRDAFVSFTDDVRRVGSGMLTVSTKNGSRKFRVSAVPDDQERETEVHANVEAALDRARARGQTSAVALLDGPAMLRGAEIGERMGMSRQAVHKAAIAGRLLALTGGSRDVRYPAWQLDETGARLDGLADVIAILGPGWPSYRFLVSTDVEGRTAFARLAGGETDAVLADARARAQADFD